MACHEIDNSRAIAQSCNPLTSRIGDAHALHYLHRSFQTGHWRIKCLHPLLKVSRFIPWTRTNIDSENRESASGQHLNRIFVAHRSALKTLWHEAIGRHNQGI